MFSDQIQGMVPAQILHAAGLEGPDQQLPTPVRAKAGDRLPGQDTALLSDLLRNLADLQLPLRRRNRHSYREGGVESSAARIASAGSGSRKRRLTLSSPEM